MQGKQTNWQEDTATWQTIALKLKSSNTRYVCVSCVMLVSVCVFVCYYLYGLAASPRQTSARDKMVAIATLALNWVGLASVEASTAEVTRGIPSSNWWAVLSADILSFLNFWVCSWVLMTVSPHLLTYLLQYLILQRTCKTMKYAARLQIHFWIFCIKILDFLDFQFPFPILEK